MRSHRIIETAAYDPSTLLEIGTERAWCRTTSTIVQRHKAR